MKKVTITITPTGYETKVELAGETYTKNTERTASGAKTPVNKEFDANVPDELQDELQSFFPYNVMEALNKF